MASFFNLEIVTPDKSFFSGEVEMAIIRTSEGDVGLLKAHEPLVAPVSVGSLRIKGTDGKFTEAACAGGFMTVTEDGVMVLTDAAEWAHEIDVNRAKEALGRAQDRIAKNAKEVDDARAKTSLARAMNRVRISGKD
ncbi:MAG: ATP synthase F1 subunit epsilon [Acidaminobacteraceae bacterium]